MPTTRPAGPPAVFIPAESADPAVTPAAVPLITEPIQPPIYNVGQPTYTPAPVITDIPDVVIEPTPPPFGAPDLPQTGLNRLPVIIMSVLGFALILLGLMDSFGKRGLKR
jgi:hypothetical protein